MNSTLLLAASLEASDPCWLLFCISAVTWRERPAPLPKHWRGCPWPWLLLASSRAALEGGGGQVGPHPSHSKIIPAEGYAKPLEGVEDPGNISGLLLVGIYPLLMSTFE